MCQVTNSRRIIGWPKKMVAIRGFTLIELLVVIAIIALLAAILFPVFSRARENGRRAACQSNMRQIGLALAQYDQDYDERLPITTSDFYTNYGTIDFGAPGAKMNFWTSMMRYIKSKQILVCPSAPVTTQGDRLVSAYSDASYMANSVLLQMSDPSGCPSSCTYDPPGRKVSSIPNPAEIISFQEASERTSVAQLYPNSAGSPLHYSYWHFNGFSDIHFTGGNLLFADGHVKWRKNSSIVAKEFGLSVINTNTPSNDDYLTPQIGYGSIF